MSHTVDIAGSLAHRITRLIPVASTSDVSDRVAVIMARHREKVTEKELLKRHDRARDRAATTIQGAVNQFVDEARERKKRDESEMVQMFLLLMLDAEADAYFDNLPLLARDADSAPVKPFTNMQRLKEAEDFAQGRQELLKEFPKTVLERLATAGEDAATVGRDIKRGAGKVVAETEAQAFYGAAELRVLQRAGYKTVKWITMDDERVRQSHRDCEAEGPIPIGRPFSNGCQYPGDPEGGVAECANCRCWLIGHSK